jgi:nitrous oxidase accessory protein NosD
MYPYGSTWGGQELVDNQVNGRDLVYIENDKDILIDDNAGQVLLYECRNITIKGQDLSNATFGLYARESRDIHILESKLDDNHYGIYFLNNEQYSSISDVSVINNSIRRTYYQIFLSSNYEMEDIEIRGNTLANGRYGIDLDAPLSSSIYSIGIEIINNTFIDFDNFGMNLISFREVDILGNNMIDCTETLRLYGNYQDDAYWFNISDNTVEGGERGFNLTSMNDLVMNNNIVKNTTDYSVKLFSIRDAEISHNLIAPLKGSGLIYSGSSYDQEFKDNTISDADVNGIGILGPFTGEFRDNELEDCGFYINPDGGGSWLSIDLDDSNSVNGRPVFFSAHQASISIPEDPGQILVKECDSVHIKDLSIENTTVGVQLVYCDTYRIENCSINDNYIGVQIRSSYDDFRGGTINRSTFRRCRYEGISVTESRLLVEECTILNCGYPYFKEGRSGIYSVEEDLILKETSFIGCGVLFDLNLKEDIVNDLMVDNTMVNGRDLMVFDSREEIEINDPAGQIYLIRCQDVTIKDQNLSDSTIGIYSVSSWGLTIENITADRCLFGIRFKCFETEAKGFSVGNSTCNKCLYEGIRVITFDSGFIDDVNFYGVECFGNGGAGLDINRVRNGFFLENSTLSGNGGSGLELIQYQGGGYKVEIANTSALDNDMNGMVITTRTKTLIYGNRLNGNGKYGMVIRDAPNNGVKIVKNNMDRNGLSGFYMADYYNDYLLDNNSFSYNHEFGIFLPGGSHEITHNEIIGNGGDGIRMPSGNNEVMWNNISLNGGNGLDIRGGSNYIHNNSIALNSDYGIFIDRYLQENRLMDNYLISNSGPLGQVLDLNGNNFWDDGKRGNFWSDHQSPDADENGIVDDPLVLPGPNVVDRYPQVMVNHPPEFLTDPSTTGMSHVLYLQ